jgi:hypothetical protein
MMIDSEVLTVRLRMRVKESVMMKKKIIYEEYKLSR